jgi:hypothetical protein
MREKTRQFLMGKWLKYVTFFRLFRNRPTGGDLDNVHSDLVTALLVRAHRGHKTLWELPKSAWLTATRQAREFMTERGRSPY